MSEKRHLPIVPPDMFDKDLPGGAFSHSQYETYKACGRAYEFKYVKGHRLPPGHRQVRGSAIHAGVESSLRFVKQQRQLPALEAQLAVVSDTFDRAQVAIEDWEDTDAGSVKAVALGLYRVYHLQALPKLNPVEIEQPFVVKVGTVTVRGAIDLLDLEKDSEADPGRIVVADLKTSAAKWSAGEVENDAQLSLYTAVLRQSRGRIDNLVSTKTPAYHRLPTTRGPRDHRNLIEDYEQTVDLIKRGTFPMAPLDSWKCTPKWCSHWRLCRGRE